MSLSLDHLPFFPLFPSLVTVNLLEWCLKSFIQYVRLVGGNQLIKTFVKPLLCPRHPLFLGTAHLIGEYRNLNPNYNSVR